MATYVRNQGVVMVHNLLSDPMTGGHPGGPVVVQVSSLRPGQYRDKTIVEKDDMEDRFFPQYTFTNMQGLGIRLANGSVWSPRKSRQYC